MVGIFLYLTITAIQRLVESGEEVERTKREAEQAQREVDQARLELDEARRRYAAEVAQRTAEGCLPKEYTSSGLVNTWNCPVR